EAAHARQREIGEDDVELLLLELRDRLDRVLDRVDGVAFRRDRDPEGVADRRFVVDDEEAPLAAHDVPIPCPAASDSIIVPMAGWSQGASRWSHSFLSGRLTSKRVVR